jgi:hypothetical protein
MERAQVVDGGDGLQTQRVAANILNKQSQTSDKGWFSSLGLGVGLTTQCKTYACYDMSQRALYLDSFFG